MREWWTDDVMAAGKLPLMLCFLAFVVTFLVTRTITRMIRAGVGPFRNNVRGGVHIHHAVPGLILLIVGAFMSVGQWMDPVWVGVAAVFIGVGCSLVLDEFALILHLTDVYWTDEGRISVDLVALAAACLGLALVGFSPIGVQGVGTEELAVRLGSTAVLVIHAVVTVVCVLKGKYTLALFGLFIPFLSLAGALRLAKPRSYWARKRYSAARIAKATKRVTSQDHRWDPILNTVLDFIAGSPSLPDPTTAGLAAPKTLPATGVTAAAAPTTAGGRRTS